MFGDALYEIATTIVLLLYPYHVGEGWLFLLILASI
jgi:hypothetical protein